MTYKILCKCPVCSSKLKVTRLKCDECGTVVENYFELSKFDYLNSEQLYFIEVFLKSRGNIKDVEKELGISYPTVRAKLDEVITSLGYTVTKQKPSVDKKDVIDMLEKGEITADEALIMLNGK
ncbi:DUF2089 domain-containing protein [Clostridium tagluense]|uniref:DUF2089 domain-containing protein n=1 Tax=Clostridium tagluense TaxID=360422 RepID=A0A401UP51_9CLOT|nr:MULTISPECIES: DUF2089 domain-containing protein [Clostridium]MBU3128501.1 DUF2089 domain-containing protein [Clostridium tagluense]MBW9157572.1 DUF2089 domain-containing protein [Clostridium tagluense]MBZ9625619.1 DUF2089 domain-containing protein [Clostridium sp. FP2]MBZ9637035.1 DUF2089 domain-containing protein [Clostridium sp. FP1]MCB2310423.1 DUF2089 domain-containing protein [Clostridium tagluense]